MRSLRAGRLTTQARYVAWRATYDPPALVRRWRGRLRMYWHGCAALAAGAPTVPLEAGSVCPRCKKFRLKRHCTAETTPCPWLECKHCDWRLRPDLYEAEAT